MKILYTTLFSIVIALIGFSAFSQSTQVKIIDLAVAPLVSPDTTIQQDTTYLNVIFKIKNKLSAVQAYYLFGTVADTGDILLSQGTFTNQGGTVYLQTNGNTNEVIGYNASAIFKLNAQQNNDFHFITVYVVDINGQMTDKLYFQK